ncbi:MAG: hypothetical protein Q6367_010540 [Candidatus Freyarchaeota archaeon]
MGWLKALFSCYSYPPLLGFGQYMSGAVNQNWSLSLLILSFYSASFGKELLAREGGVLKA